MKITKRQLRKMIIQEISSIRENMEAMPKPSPSMRGLVAVQDHFYEIEPFAGLGTPAPVEAGVAVVATRKDKWRLPDEGAVIVADYPSVGEFLEAVKQLQRNQLKLDGELGSIIDQRVDEIDATDMIPDEQGEIVGLGDIYRAAHEENSSKEGPIMEGASAGSSAMIEIPYHRDMNRARKALNNWGVPHQAGVGIIEVRRQDLSDAQAALDSVRVGYRR